MTSKSNKAGNQNAARGQKNRQMRQEALREQLAAQKLLESIDRHLDRAEKLRAAVAQGRESDRLEADRTELQIIKVQLDAGFKKLNKVLPDLKSQDVQGTINHAHYDPSPTDRATAAYLGMTLDDYMEAKEAGELPELPELPPEPEWARS